MSLKLYLENQRISRRDNSLIGYNDYAFITFIDSSFYTPMDTIYIYPDLCNIIALTQDFYIVVCLGGGILV